MRKKYLKYIETELARLYDENKDPQIKVWNLMHFQEVMFKSRDMLCDSLTIFNVKVVEDNSLPMFGITVKE